MPPTLRNVLTVSSGLVLCVACQVPTGCTPGSAATGGDAFDGDRAWAHAVHQVEIGPRPAGTEANARCRTYIESELRSYALEPKLQTFKEATPAGELEFTNVWAEIQSNESKSGLVLIGSHFDTKRMTFPFVGANDGASSTAVLLELARVLASGGKRAFTYRFVFLDGEEAVRPEWQDPDNTYGSRYHANELKRLGRNTDVRAFILLDMVGDKDLHLTRDTYSDRGILECFFGAARQHGLGSVVDGKQMEIRDDHMSFMAVGIKSIDLMDFEYGPQNKWWHSADDTLANCSKDSLRTVGRIVLQGLPALEAHLLGK